jgi:hypothetical protein
MGSSQTLSAEDAPPSPNPSSLAVQLLDPGDLRFLQALSDAGRLAEMDEAELLRMASEAEDAESSEAGRVDLLELYYAAGGDAEVATRRRRADRFFVQKVGEPATAAGLVDRLAALAPEIGAATLTRIGGGDDGPLVIQAGENFAAVLDDYDEDTDTDQAEQRQSGIQMVTVRGLVRALNVLLEKANVKERLIGIRSDVEREVYLSLGLSDAMAFTDADYLENDARQDVMTLGAW